MEKPTKIEKKVRVDGLWYTKQEVATKMGLKLSTTSRRLSDTPEPWTWDTLTRQRYKPSPAKYRIDEKTYTITEVATELGISIHAARGRIYERLESHGKLSWVHLRRNMRGSRRLAKLLGNKPAGRMIRNYLNAQNKTITFLGRAIGIKSSESIRKIVSGEVNLTPQMTERIADALMLDADETNDLLIAGAQQAGWNFKRKKDV